MQCIGLIKVISFSLWKEKYTVDLSRGRRSSLNTIYIKKDKVYVHVFSFFTRSVKYMWHPFFFSFFVGGGGGGGKH